MSADTPASSSAVTSAPATVSSIFQQLVDALGTDAISKLKSVLGTAAADVQANPTATNASVQVALLAPAFVRVAPQLQTDAIFQIAASVQKLLGLIPDTISTPAAAASSPTPAAAAPAAS